MKTPVCLLASCLFPLTLAAAPLKVFILAGQSNMQGHARISTIEPMTKDPKTAELASQMMDAEGKPVTCRRTWISYVSEGSPGQATLKEGQLTVGFGAADDKIGPEFTFGLAMEKALDGPILLIKTAWGGKNIHTDFRPPSASGEGAGVYYQLMIDHVRKVLEDPAKVVPGYKKGDGYEIAGFVWFQGWNDIVDRNHYPDRDKEAGYDAYTESLAHFIRDVRKDLKAPNMPFVIGVLGAGGEAANMEPRYQAIYSHFHAAMAAPAAMPEFQGNVTAVHTAKYWDAELAGLQQKKDHTPEEQEKLKAISNQVYHYLGAAKILGPIGQAFAESMLTMMKK